MLKKFYTFDDSIIELEKRKLHDVDGIDRVYGESIVNAFNAKRAISKSLVYDDKNFAGSILDFSNYVSIGGEGVVLNCHDIALDIEVALKVFFKQSNEPGVVVVENRGLFKKTTVKNENTFRERFLRQARVQANIHKALYQYSHVGIVPYVAEISTDPCWIRMQYIDSEKSLSFLKDKKLSEIIRCCHRLLYYVCLIHNEGIIHRDLKVDNVLFTTNGSHKPVIVDFGGCKDLKDPGDITQDDVSLGSPIYMSPEVAAGNAKIASFPNDVYNLAGCLWSFFMRRKPTKDDHPSFDCLKKVYNRETSSYDYSIDLSKVTQRVWPTKGIPKEFREFFDKSLSRDIRKRYQVSHDMLVAFEEAMRESGEPIPDYKSESFKSREHTNSDVHGDYLRKKLSQDETQELSIVEEVKSRYPEAWKYFYACVNHIIDEKIKKIET